MKGEYDMKKQVMITTLLFSLTLGLASCGSSRENEIIVGGKEFTEQQIFTHLMSELIEDRTDLKVTRKAALGGTQVIFSAITNDDIDIYIDYTGTGYVSILGYDPISDPTIVYNTVKEELLSKHDIVVLDQINVNNTYVLAVTKDFAQENNLSKISDLKSISDTMIGGFTYEFINRQDGLIGLEEAYDLSFKENSAFEGSLRYQALLNNDVQITTAFSTDSLIKKFDLVSLEDDLSFFPPYYAVPFLRKEVYEKHPELEAILKELGNVLDDETMVSLNYEVDENAKEPRDVARNFLLEKGLIS
jgi:osmoprotectant transport system permease protein